MDALRIESAVEKLRMLWLERNKRTGRRLVSVRTLRRSWPGQSAVCWYPTERRNTATAFGLATWRRNRHQLPHQKKNSWLPFRAYYIGNYWKLRNKSYQGTYIQTYRLPEIVRNNVDDLLTYILKLIASSWYFSYLAAVAHRSCGLLVKYGGNHIYLM
jgi:hypothetical protein